jgi:type II secretory pathway component GspD/PulD (secretin)
MILHGVAIAQQEEGQEKQPPSPDALASQPSAALPGSEQPAAPAAGSEEKITLVFNEGPIERVVSELSRKSGRNVAARGKTSGQKVTLLVRDMPIERVLDIVVNQKPNWLWYKPEDQPNTYEIWDHESFRAEVLPRQVRQKVFVPREITAEEAYKAIQGVLTPNIGAASFDPRSNKIIVTDLPYVLELIQRLIEQIDVKFMTRVFYIAHADVNSIAEKLANLKSPAAPAPEVDERTHQIIVRDRIEIIRQMELLVETLDIGPEMRVYNLNNIGWEGADRQDLEDAISEVLTADAYYKLNVQSGKLIVEDVPEVHEKIEKILQAFDQPAKQVLIEVEILETAFREGFNYSMDWSVSGDLFSSVVDGLTGRTTGATPAGGSVPVGSGTVDSQTLGFIDFRKEFPIVSAGGGGIDAKFLSRHAFIQLKAAMSDSRTRVLQQPRAIVKNQKEVIFSVGEKVPFFTSGYYNTNVNNNNQNYGGGPQQNLINVGLDLNIRPTVYNNGLIEMEVEISNDTAVVTKRQYAGQNYDAVGTKNQEIQSTLIVPSGETRVIGGLVRQDRNESKSGVPGLIKIPLLGPLLFGKYDKPEEQNGRGMLLIFLTPTILAEKPADMLKYKGEVVADENAVVSTDAFTTPGATLSDTYIEPIPPANIPASAYMPARPETRPARRVASRELPIPEPDEEQEELEAGMQELKKVRIQENITTGPQAMVPRIPGPSGALTGTSAAGATPATGAAPSPGGTPSVFRPPAPPAPTPPPPPQRPRQERLERQPQPQQPVPPPVTETRY